MSSSSGLIRGGSSIPLSFHFTHRWIQLELDSNFSAASVCEVHESVKVVTLCLSWSLTEESCSGSDLRAQLSAGKRKSFHDVAGCSYSCTCLQSAESAHTRTVCRNISQKSFICLKSKRSLWFCWFCSNCCEPSELQKQTKLSPVNPHREILCVGSSAGTLTKSWWTETSSFSVSVMWINSD